MSFYYFVVVESNSSQLVAGATDEMCELAFEKTLGQASSMRSLLEALQCWLELAFAQEYKAPIMEKSRVNWHTHTHTHSSRVHLSLLLLPGELDRFEA